MRTTLTLDPDVALRIKQEMQRQNKSLKDTVNDALRKGLNLVLHDDREEPFQVEAHDFRFRPGIDLDRMNQLVDELEAEDIAARHNT